MSSALLSATDGQANPSDITQALARGARMAERRSRRHRVLSVEVLDA